MFRIRLSAQKTLLSLSCSTTASLQFGETSPGNLFILFKAAKE